MAIVMAGATLVTITAGAIFATVLDGVIPLIEAVKACPSGCDPRPVIA